MWWIKQVVPYVVGIIALIVAANWLGNTTWPLVPEGNVQMDPAIPHDENVTVDKSRRTIPDLRYGDVINYRYDLGDPAVFINIGRVVAMEGDTVAVEDGRLVINDNPLNEPWIAEDRQFRPEDVFPRVHVPRGTVFVMVDNRTGRVRGRPGWDSRTVGPIPEFAIVGVIESGFQDLGMRNRRRGD